MPMFLFLIFLFPLLLTSLPLNPPTFDLPSYMLEQNNQKRKNIFNIYLSTKIQTQKCVSNLEMISEFYGILEGRNLMFEEGTSVLHQKLFFEEVLKGRRYQKRWKDWDDMTKSYQLCFYEETSTEEDIRAPSRNPMKDRHLVSMRGTFDRYPYLYYQIFPASITYLLSLIPTPLKQTLHIARFILYSNKFYHQIYSKSPYHTSLAQTFIWKLVALGNKLKDLDIVVYLGDTINQKMIHEYCEKQVGWDLGMYDTKFELYKKVIVELPGFMWGKDLENGLEFNKLLTVDYEVGGKGWEDKYLEVIEGTRAVEWGSKVEKGYFRGSMIGESQGYYDTGKNIKDTFPRLHLFNLSMFHPSYLDAKPYFLTPTTIPSFFQQPSISTIILPTPILPQLHYKYMLSLDGPSAPFSRLPWHLLSKSLVLKQQTSRIQWFFDHLHPYVHYVPINPDLSDLFEIIQFARNNDEFMREIAEEGNLHAIDRFSEKRLWKDFARIFNDYADIQKVGERGMDIERLVENGMEFVTIKGRGGDKVEYLERKGGEGGGLDMGMSVVFLGCLGMMMGWRYVKRREGRRDRGEEFVKIRRRDGGGEIEAYVV